MAAKGATKQQLLLMLLWGSCNLEVTQNMRTLLLVASADYPHHLLCGTRPGTAGYGAYAARGVRVAFFLQQLRAARRGVKKWDGASSAHARATAQRRGETMRWGSR